MEVWKGLAVYMSWSVHDLHVLELGRVEATAIGLYVSDTASAKRRRGKKKEVAQRKDERKRR